MDVIECKGKIDAVRIEVRVARRATMLAMRSEAIALAWSSTTTSGLGAVRCSR